MHCKCVESVCIMSVISNPSKNISNKERQDVSDKPQESFVKRNIVPIAISAGVASGVGSQLLSTALMNIMKPKAKHKHKHGFGLGKLGAIAAAASFIHPLVHPFTCGGGGAFLMGAGALASFLPRLWGGGHKHTPKCGHHHAKKPPSPASSPKPVAAPAIPPIKS